VGALGPVFRTYEPARDRLVAVKLFRLDITPEQSKALADELSRAADAGLFHPSIVEPIAAGVEGTAAYRAEEYVAAESLDVAMRHYAPASMEKALPIIAQLAGAIDFARAVSVGHGALHPRDIFVTPDEARATGFGVVEALERVGLRAPVRRPYSAPERIEGAAWNASADVFSLAAIAYELLTGRRPAGIGEDIGPLAGTNVGSSARAVRSVLVRATDNEPARRYPTALAFASALEAAARGQHAGAIADRPPVAVPAAAPAPPQERAQENEPSAEDERDADQADFALARAEQDAAETAPLPFAGDPDEETADRLAPLLGSAATEPSDRFAGASPNAAPRQHDTGDRSKSRDPARLEHEAFARLGRSETAHDDLLDQSPPQYAYEEELDENASGAAVENEHDLIRTQSETGGPSMFAMERPRSAAVPIAVMLIIGLLLGFAGGYVVGGRNRGASTPAAVSEQRPPAARSAAPQPAGKEWSEQAVKPPAVAPPVPGDTPLGTRPPAAAAAPRSIVRPTPAATTGTLVVRSTPSGAGVIVNGRWRGRTPLTLERLPFARYTVRIVQSGYAVAREEAALSAAVASRTLAVRLQPQGGAATARRGESAETRQGTAAGARPGAAPSRASQPETYTGSVYVDSRPSGARVFIDGAPVGTTPVRVPEVRVGSHVIRMELADHRPWTASTRVAAGDVARVTGSLERIR
jgi:hypothetical protein